ncbi:MAG: GNAT family N-acetyltransferase [Cytophagia bacterium]|jgi:RimJ/RimL family protein N-acetyltransferase|nr:GNAT family N-acetyltransferase [Cytophagia bacterium]
MTRFETYPPKIHLKPFEKDDIDRLIEWVQTEEFLMIWSGPEYSYPLTKSQLEQSLLNASKINPSNYMFKACTQKKEIIGHGEIMNYDRKNNSATLARILIGPGQFRGKGLGLQLILELMKYSFRYLKLHRLTLNVFSFNESAIKCYQRAGFKIEGELKDVRKIKNEYWSNIVMTILEDEYYGLNEK